MLHILCVIEWEHPDYMHAHLQIRWYCFGKGTVDSWLLVHSQRGCMSAVHTTGLSCYCGLWGVTWFTGEYSLLVVHIHLPLCKLQRIPMFFHGKNHQFPKNEKKKKKSHKLENVFFVSVFAFFCLFCCGNTCPRVRQEDFIFYFSAYVALGTCDSLTKWWYISTHTLSPVWLWNSHRGFQETKITLKLKVWA